MHRILLSAAAAAFVLGSAGAMAQTSAPPVPNASGSQTTNPSAVGSTANDHLNRQDSTVGTTGSVTPGVVPMVPGSSTVPPVPNASGSQTTNPAGTGSTATQQLNR
jgi:hypothetical protein